MSDVPDTGAFGCRLPFGLGLMAFVALAILAVTLAAFALPLLFGGGLPGQGPGGNGQGAPNGPGADDGIPAVSDRYFSTGSAQASVTGGISISPSIGIDPIASYAQDGLVWLSFIDPGNPGAGEVLVAFNEPEDSVAVAQGSLRAIGVDDACTFDVAVTAGLISGHVACPSVDVYDGDKDTGNDTSIQLDFSATTDSTVAPDGGDGGDEDGG